MCWPSLCYPSPSPSVRQSIHSCIVYLALLRASDYAATNRAALLLQEEGSPARQGSQVQLHTRCEQQAPEARAWQVLVSAWHFLTF
jgi:hypothetical protein